MKMLFLSAALLGLSACGGGGYDDAPIDARGTLRLSLADAPACGYDKVNVTVQKVRVHQSSGAAENDAEWREIVLEPALRVDLLTLQNGVLKSLGQASVPAGRYQQLRLVLEENSAANPLANSVVPSAGVETALETPSAQQSGLKLNTQIDVTANQLADFAIDFNACKSVLRAGNSGRFQLKPVLSVIPILVEAGQRVVGFVDQALADGAATVSAQQAGVPVRATSSDGNGKFVLYPLPTGSYDLVIRAYGRVVAVVTGVPVSAAVTTIGNEDVRLSPPPSNGSVVVSGTLSVNGSPAGTGGSVRASQSLSGGPTVEAGDTLVDATTGAYSLYLPLDAPARLAYSAGATSLPFTSNAADAGKFRFEATATGFAAKTSDQVLSGNLTLNFSFP